MPVVADRPVMYSVKPEADGSFSFLFPSQTRRD